MSLYNFKNQLAAVKNHTKCNSNKKDFCKRIKYYIKDTKCNLKQKGLCKRIKYYIKIILELAKNTNTNIIFLCDS